MREVRLIKREAYFQFTFEWTETTHSPDASGGGGMITTHRGKQLSTHGQVTVTISTDDPDAYDPAAFHESIRGHARRKAAEQGYNVPANARVIFASIEPLAGYLDRFQTSIRPIIKEI